MPYSEDLKDKQADQATRIVESASATDAERPDFICASQARQWKLARVVRDVYRGTANMRERGRAYLPQLMVEGDAEYKRRLDKAKLFNAVRRTADGLAGMVCRKDPVLEVPAPIETDAENIDLAGRALPIFAKDVLLAGLLDGISFVHVDYPSAPPRQSRAEDQAMNLRPFWRHIELEHLINWRWETVRGSPVLRMAVLEEPNVEPLGTYGEELVTRYRVLRPGSWELWEEMDINGKRVWQQVDEGAVSLDYIPLFPFYARRVDFMEAEPPLLDLAFENIGHWELKSEREKSRTIAHIPLLGFYGFPDDAQIKISAETGIRSTDSTSRCEWTVYEGQALSESRLDLHDTEARMASLGLSLLLSRPSPQGSEEGTTATSDILRKGESDSALATAARSLEDCLENALVAHADFRGLPDGGSVSVNTDFHEQAMDPQTLQALSAMVSEGKLPLETLWAMMIQGEILDETFDPEKARFEMGLPEVEV